MARAASASMQSVLALHERRAQKQWEKVLSNLLRRRRRAVRHQPTRLRRLLLSWRRIARVSFMVQNLLSTAAAPPSEMFQRFRKRRVRVLLKCPFSLLAHRVPVGMDLARCSPLNWTEDSAEPLLKMIALPIRVASPSIQTKTCC